MTWVKIDDSFHDHPKVLRAGVHAIGLHILALTHCSRHLTDGHVEKGFVKRAAGQNATRLTRSLVESGLWETNGDGGWRIHDYLDFNPSREEVLAKRGWDQKRKSLFADKELVAAIRRRDGDMCRYCGTIVNWRDRKGPAGGTYDHVIPRGDNSLENLVVVCRECNSRKGGRTPEQANMPLIQVEIGPDHG